MYQILARRNFSDFYQLYYKLEQSSLRKQRQVFPLNKNRGLQTHI